MAYTRYIADWKNYPDTSTPITEAALEYVETGIVNAHVTADAALPKSTFTTKGDEIVATGSSTYTRLAAGANGTIRIADSSAGVGQKWTGGFATSLPGSPVDGEEVILVDSLSAPTYQWHLKYISAATTYKWYFIGGSPSATIVATSETRANAAFGDLATVGPDFTTPAGGDWIITVGCQMVQANTSKRASMSYALGGTVASDVWAAQGSAFAFTDMPNGEYLERTYKHTGIASASLIRAKYRGGDGNEQGTFASRILFVTPVRLG